MTNRSLAWSLMVMLAAGAVQAGPEAPKDARGEAARQAFRITDLVLQQDIDPPARQQMLLSGVKALLRQTPGETVPNLSARVSAVTTPEQFAALLAEVWPADAHPDADGEGPEHALFRGLLAWQPGDRRRAYLSPPQRKAHEVLTGNRYVGTGIQIRRDQKEDLPRIVIPIAGGPARKAGARPGDLIVAVDGRSMKGLTLREVVRRLQGEEGTKVTMTVRQPGEDKVRQLPLVRSVVPFASVQGYRRTGEESWSFRVDREVGVGYLALNDIKSSTLLELRKIEPLVHDEGVRALVLDLRFTQGAEMHHAALVADGLLDGGVLWRVRGADRRIKEYKADRDCLFRDMPLAVLVGEHTEGMAEVLAAALQDRGRAIVVGTPTKGDLTVTSLVPLPDRQDALLLRTGTVERVAPARKAPDGRVVPDHLIACDREQMGAVLEWRHQQESPEPRADAKPPADPQLARAVALLRERLAGSRRAARAGDDNDPRYGGKHVSEWLAWLNSSDSATASATRSALRRVDAKELPVLLGALKHPKEDIRRGAARVLGEIGPAAAPGLKDLVPLLKDTDADVRVAAATAIGHIGSTTNRVMYEYETFDLTKPSQVNRKQKEMASIALAVQATIPALIDALQDQDENVCLAAANALREIGPEAKAGVPALISALKDGNQPVRTAAAAALGGIGPEAKAAVPALIDALKDKDRLLRWPAAGALGRIGPAAKVAVPSLLEAAKDPDSYVRGYSMEALGHIGSGEERVVARLAAALKDPEAQVRIAAAYALVQLGPKAKAAAPALLDALKDPEAGVRCRAAVALAGMNAEPKTTVSGLITLLKDVNPDVREAAVHALARIGPDAEAATLPLAEVLKDPNPRMRDNAAWALGSIGFRAKAAVPALLAALKDADAQVRFRAVDALAEIGPIHKAVVPALVESLNDRDKSVRYWAIGALGEFGPAAEAAAGPLAKVLKDLKPEDRWHLFLALSKLGSGAKAAVPVLIADLKDPDARLRADAARALGDIGSHAGAARAPLMKALKDGDAEVRASAVHSLGEIGLEAKTAVPLFLNGIRDKDASVRSSAAWALGHYPTEAKVVVPPLVHALRDKEAQVRRDAARALGKFGAASTTAVPALIEAAKDSAPDVRLSANGALVRIEPKKQKERLASLIAAFTDKDADIRREATATLGDLGQLAQPVVPELLKALHSSDRDFALIAGITLVRIAPDSPAVLRAFVEDLKNANPELRRRAAQFLSETGPAAKPAVEPLLDALRDKERGVRREAARALKKIDPEAAKRAGVL